MEKADGRVRRLDKTFLLFSQVIVIVAAGLGALYFWFAIDRRKELEEARGRISDLEERLQDQDQEMRAIRESLEDDRSAIGESVETTRRLERQMATLEESLAAARRPSVPPGPAPRGARPGAGVAAGPVGARARSAARRAGRAPPGSAPGCRRRS